MTTMDDVVRRQGQALQQARKAQGLSQRALAERMGVSSQTVFRWESGRSRPNAEDIVRAAKALGVSPAGLLGVDELVTADVDGARITGIPGVVEGMIERAAKRVTAMPPVDDPEPGVVELLSDRGACELLGIDEDVAELLRAVRLPGFGINTKQDAVRLWSTISANLDRAARNNGNATAPERHDVRGRSDQHG